MSNSWIPINQKLIQNVADEAKSSPRLRKNHNFHQDLTDPINRMLNAFEPGTYCRHHKHENPDKREVFIALKGRMAVLFFDDKGGFIGKEEIEPLSETIAVEIPAGLWHTVVCLESGSVVYEIKDGPYFVPTDKDFAPWAPKEGDPECEAYLQDLIKKAGLDVTLH